MKRLWWYLLDELCAIAEDNLEQGHYEIHKRADGYLYIYPRAMV
jgi:hypothetical protein